MNKNTIIIIVAVAILVLGGFLLLKQPKESEIKPLSSEGEEIVATSTTRIATPNGAVLEFMNKLYQAVPPKSDPEALVVMQSLLSPMATKTTLSQEGNYDPLSFLGIQTVPDLGYEIVGVRYADNLATAQTNAVAEVTVKFKDTRGDIEKTFILSKTQDYWLIDGLLQSEIPSADI